MNPVGSSKGVTDNLKALIKSGYLSELVDGRPVLTLTLPDETLVSLTAFQATAARIEPHGNFGRTTVRFQIDVEATVQGDVEQVREAIQAGLLREILALRGDVATERKKAAK